MATPLGQMTAAQAAASGQTAAYNALVNSYISPNAGYSYTGGSGSGVSYSGGGQPPPNYNPSTPAQSVGTVQPFSIPQQPQSQNYSGLIANNNAGLGVMQNPTTTQTDQTNQPVDPGQAAFEKYLSSIKPPPSLADAYSQAESQAGIQQKRQAVQNYTNQLNEISARSQANQLAVTGQGRGIPEVIIGGQQAQISKEAAIQSLPLQALLSAAQGDLNQAQTHLDTLFQMYATDAQNQVDYYNKYADTVYQYASKKEQQQIDAAKEDKATRNAYIQDLNNNAQQLATYALQSGNSAVFRALTNLQRPNPISKTYEADVAKYQAAIAKYGGQIGMGGGGDRLLTLDEASKYNVPYGTKLSDMQGKTLGGGTNPDIQKENAQDYQFAKQARDSVMSVVKTATGKTDISQLTADDLSKLNDSESLQVSKALSILSNPKATRATGGEDALGPTGWVQSFITNPTRQIFTGKKYSPDNLLNAVKTIESNFQSIQNNFNGTTINPLSPISPVPPTNNTRIIPKGTDGTAYGFPGYVSDGTQWVPK